MKIIEDLKEYSSEAKTFITIGTFDGIHAGHRKVLQHLIKSAARNNAKSVVFTFFPHPRMVLQKESNIKLLNTLNERIELLRDLGLDILVIHRFTTEFSKIPALHFVRDILVNTLHVSKLIIGYDHQFGKDREGDFEQLEALSRKFGFSIEKTSKLDIEEIAVSSTKIRKAISNGDIQKANAYLGYEYQLTGTIVPGMNLGEKLGFPTANLFVEESYKLLPKTGAYIVKSTLNGKLFYGMMNIGFRPTVSGKNKTIEIHFFDLKTDLYDKKIQVEVLEFLREEIRFESLDLLKDQLSRDRAAALSYIKGGQSS